MDLFSLSNRRSTPSPAAPCRRSPGPFRFVRQIAACLAPTSSGQRRALAGLLALAEDDDLDPVPLLEAWACDERGWQRYRVRKLARLLGRGASLGEALERVPNAVRREDATALLVAAGLGGDAEAAIGAFDAPASSTDPVDRGARWTVTYALMLGAVFLPICIWIAVRIGPQFARIYQDFGADPTPWTGAAAASLRLVGRLSYLAILGAAVALLAKWAMPRAWRGFVRAVTLGDLGTAADARAAECLGSLDVAAGVHAGAGRAAGALASATTDAGLRARLRRGGDMAAGILSPAESAALAGETPLGRSWVAVALARRHRERILDRRWLVSELVFPLVVLLAGAFVFVQAMGMMVPLTRLIMGLA